MQTKLTLRLDARLINRAKRYARLSGKSVSTVVADYFSALATPPEEPTVLLPKVRSLLGALPPDAGDAATYRRYLESKHR